MEIIPNFGRHRNVSSIRDDSDLVVINEDESNVYHGSSTSPMSTTNNRNFGYPISISTTATFHPPNFQSPEEIQVEPTLEYYQNNDEIVDYLSRNSIQSSMSYHSNYHHNHNQEIPNGGMVVTSNNECNPNNSCYSQLQQQNFTVPRFHYQEPEENFISIDDIKAKSFLFDVHKKKNNEEPKDVVIIDDDDEDDTGGRGGDDGNNDNNNNEEENKRKTDSAISETHDDYEDDDDVILIEDDEEEIINNEVGVELDWVAFEQEHEQEQDKQSYECFLCNKKVASSYNLRRHMMIHTGERPFGCDICFKRFREFSDLKKHRRVHCHEKEYKCMVCKINVPSITNSTKCSECDVEERQSRTTSNYGDILLGEVPCIEGSDRKAYVCPICDRIFGSRHNLKRHFMIHTGEKPYKCDVCEKAFREVSTLKKHMLTHSRIKLFKCTVCGREYSDFATYTRHKNASHPHQNSLINISSSSLLTSGNNLSGTLSLSSLSTSNNSSSSGSSSGSGGNNGFVISSVRSGTGEYSAITAKRSSSFYASHANNNTDLEEYLFECSDCYKKFSNASIYKEHLKLHSRDFTFQCYICKKMFRTKEKLNAHFVTHEYDEDEEERLNRLNVSRKIEYQTELYLQQQQQRQQQQQQQQFHH